MKRILITGVAGFIGSSLAELLIANNYRVAGIDNFDNFYSKDIKTRNLSGLLKSEHFNFFEESILNIERVKELGTNIDCIIHLAAKAGVQPSIRSPQEYIDTNLKGTQSILDFMVKNQVPKIIFGSSSSIYGNSAIVPFDEAMNTDAQISPYAVTKKAGELLCRTYHHLYNVDIVCLRFFTVYGPRQRPDLAIHKFFNLIEQNKPIEMYGDGTMARDYTYITDIIEGINLSLDYIFSKKDIFEIINIGNEYPVSLSDLVKKISLITPNSVKINSTEIKPGDVQITFANINKAKSLLGYNPKVSIDEGLASFYQWYKRSLIN